MITLISLWDRLRDEPYSATTCSSQHTRLDFTFFEKVDTPTLNKSAFISDLKLFYIHTFESGLVGKTGDGGWMVWELGLGGFRIQGYRFARSCDWGGKTSANK